MKTPSIETHQATNKKGGLTPERTHIIYPPPPALPLMSHRIYREQYTQSQSSSMHASQIHRSASLENSPQSQYNRSSSPNLIQTADVFSTI